jgi:membrane protein YdbS with pleckstrin-like domain
LSTNTAQSSVVIWTGKPWITPDVIARTILVIVLGVIIVWLEGLDNAAAYIILGIQVWTWTLLAFLVIWLISLIPLLLLRAAHKYTLRSGSLEVKTGIASLQTFVLSPSGFSDLEIDQSLLGRMVGYGNIIIHTQSERAATMHKVRDPNKVASQIRDLMGKPIVRIEGQPPTQNQ